MTGRKEKYMKMKKMKTIKKLIGTVFLIGLLSSSFTVAFAEEDIQSLLDNWFGMRKQEAMNEISLAINDERVRQTNRLKEELQSAIVIAEQELNQFTASEIETRREKLRLHTDELISNIEIDNEEEKAEIRNQLETIYLEAVEKLTNVNVKGGELTPTEGPDEEVKEESSHKEEETPVKEEPPVDSVSSPTDMPPPGEPSMPEKGSDLQ